MHLRLCPPPLHLAQLLGGRRVPHGVAVRRTGPGALRGHRREVEPRGSQPGVTPVDEHRAARREHDVAAVRVPVDERAREQGERGAHPRVERPPLELRGHGGEQRVAGPVARPADGRECVPRHHRLPPCGVDHRDGARAPAEPVGVHPPQRRPYLGGDVPVRAERGAVVERDDEPAGARGEQPRPVEARHHPDRPHRGHLDGRCPLEHHRRAAAADVEVDPLDGGRDVAARKRAAPHNPGGAAQRTPDGRQPCLVGGRRAPGGGQGRRRSR